MSELEMRAVRPPEKDAKIQVKLLGFLAVTFAETTVWTPASHGQLGSFLLRKWGGAVRWL